MSHFTRSVAILAGGQATRFGGRDKSALLMDGCAIPDAVPGCGPVGGLHPARNDVLLLGACDMPYVSAPSAEHLLSLAGDADLVVPQTKRGSHPLCAVYTRACLEPAAAQLVDRRLKMRELVDRMRTRVVPVEDFRRFGDPIRLLANVNTPADYAVLEALQGHKP